MWINSHIAVCLMKYVYYDRMCLSFMPRQIIICNDLTHWGRVTHICVSKLTSVGSDNGLSPGRRQAIIWTSAGILLIGPLGTNFRENLTEIHIFSFNKSIWNVVWKMAYILSRYQCVRPPLDEPGPLWWPQTTNYNIVSNHGDRRTEEFCYVQWVNSTTRDTHLSPGKTFPF